MRSRIGWFKYRPSHPARVGASMEQTRVAAVFQRYAHHSAWSGYPRFLDWLDGRVRVRRPVPFPFPTPLLRRASSRIEYEWFGPEQLQLDLTAGRRLVTGRRELVHLLYGETHHFYAGRL